MVIFSKVRLGVNPEINALATILIVAVALAVLIAGVVMSQQERQRQRDIQKAIAANQ
jgi:putrescine transport system permease protein